MSIIIIIIIIIICIICIISKIFTMCAVYMCVQLTHYTSCVRFAQKFFPTFPECVQFTYAQFLLMWSDSVHCS